MSWNEFVSCVWKEHVADLRSGFDSFGAGHFVSIPKLDGFVSGSTSSGKKGGFMWRPSKGLDSGCMLLKFANGLIHSGFPNKYKIVVSTWGKEVVISGPFQTTNFLFMTLESIDNRLSPYIPDKHLTVFGPSSDKIAIAININTTNPSKMFLIPMRLDFLFNIDHPHTPSFLSNQKSFSPLDTTYVAFN